MLSKFFRRRAGGKHGLFAADPDQRRQALASLADPTPAQQQRIEQLAAEDPDPEVRAAAVGHSVDPALLQQLLDDALLADTAAQRLLALKPDTSIDHPRLINARLTSGIVPEPGDIAQLAPDAYVEALINSRGDARKALLAAPLLARQTVLTALEKQSRNRDKTLNRLARDHLDAARNNVANFTALKERAEELVEALEKHLRGDPAAAGYTDKHQQLRQRLDATMTELGEVTGLLEMSGISADGSDTLKIRISSLPALRSATEVAQDSAPFVHLSAEFVELEQSLKTGANVSEALNQHSALTQRWLAAAADTTPDDAAHALFTRVNALAGELSDASSALTELPALPVQPLAATLPDKDNAGAFWTAVESRRRWLREARTAQRRVRWPDQIPQPDAIVQLGQAIERDSQTLEQLDQAIERHLASLQDHLNNLQAQIEAGASQAAAQSRTLARNAIQILPRARVRNANRTLNALAAKLGELKDWQTFATTPKREALCEQMSALADQPLEPAEQADRIKALRRQWNELGNPGSNADRELANVFNAAAEKAFEPCREYFADQAALRETNRQAREAICEQLSGYLESTDFTTTDIKAAEQIMRTARSEWQRFQPVERRQGKALEQRFESLQAALHTQIKAQWDTNLAAKAAIVDAARALLDDAAPVHDAVERAKALQQQWRQVGPTPRRPDQQLWQEFRGICDQVFAARDEARNQANEAVALAQEQAQTLLDRFQASLAESFDGAVLRQFESQFAELPELPEQIARSIRKRYQRLHDDAEAQLQQQADARKLAQLRAQLDEDAQREANGDYASESDLQRLVIEAEIAADIESTDADRDLRMQIQVELMNTGRSHQALSAQPKDLVAAWRALPAKNPAHAHLRQRFDAAISALISA